MVSQGTGTNASTGASVEWGKTGTTENNGDAWFVGATQDVTVAVWVGHANSVKPMLTEFGGAPVDGGTIPALIFHDVVLAYEQLNPDRAADEDESTTEEHRPPRSAARRPRPRRRRRPRPRPRGTPSSSRPPNRRRPSGGASGGTGGGISPG